MNEPRPSITSARPLESASTVAKRWKTRTGSSELSTVTPEARWMRSVCVAIPASTVSGAEIANSGRWCSPTAMTSMPMASARTPSATTRRIASAYETISPRSSRGRSPKVSMPNSMLSTLASLTAGGQTRKVIDMSIMPPYD